MAALGHDVSVHVYLHAVYVSRCDSQVMLACYTAYFRLYRAFSTHSKMLISRGQEWSFGLVERPTAETTGGTLCPR